MLKNVFINYFILFLVKIYYDIQSCFVNRTSLVYFNIAIQIIKITAFRDKHYENKKNKTKYL